MATFNNKKIFERTPYIQSQLIYNLPIILYINDDGTLEISQIRVKAYKIDNTDTTIPESKRMRIPIAKEFVQGKDFEIKINNTKDGIILRFFENINEANEILVVRNTLKDFPNNYTLDNQTTSLNFDLESDINRLGNIVQEHDFLIIDLQNEVGKYSNEILKRNVFSVFGREGNILAQQNDYNANQVKLEINSSIYENATNVQDGFFAIENQLKDALTGLKPRASCLLANADNEIIDVTQEIFSLDGIALIDNGRYLIKNLSADDEYKNAINGIYIYNETTHLLTRSNDNSTLININGSRVKVLFGNTNSEKEWDLRVVNVDGILNTEFVYVEKVLANLDFNQVENYNLAKMPPQTLIGNNNNIKDTPDYIPYSEIKISMALNNVDNTLDINKPISILQQSALDLKANLLNPEFTGTPKVPTAIESDNSNIIANTSWTKNQLAKYQQLLQIGGNNDYIGFNDGVITNKPLNKNSVGLDNVNNTDDIDKPISDLQRKEFNKCFEERDSLDNLEDFNDLKNLLLGTYYIPSTVMNDVLNKPSTFSSGSSATLDILNYFSNSGDTKKKIKYILTEYIPILPTPYFKIYIRYYNVQEDIFSNWEYIASQTDIDIINKTIQDIIVGSFTESIYTQDQTDNLLSSKEDKLPQGGSDIDYLSGNKEWKPLTTQNVIESPSNLYYTDEKVKNYLDTYQNPTDLGKIVYYEFPTAVIPPSIRTFENGVKAYLFNDQIINKSMAPVLFNYWGINTDVKLSNMDGIVILGSGSKYYIGKTGGEETHLQTLDELAGHTHIVQTYDKNAPTTAKDRMAQFVLGKYTDSIETEPSSFIHNPFNIMQPYIAKACYLLAW